MPDSTSVQIEPIGGTLTPPTRLSQSPTTVRVWGVTPCFNRPGDLMLLLQDLSRLELSYTPDDPGGATDRAVRIELRLIVVDNASTNPLTPEASRLPDSLNAQFLRLPANVGGSGGYNAGIRRALTELEQTERESGTPATESFIWLVDSDARVTARTLRHLVDVLLARPDAAAVGSAIADPRTGQVFELGGMVDRAHGRFRPATRGVAGIDEPVECDYVAACSALVRASAVRATGLLPDVFLNADDVEWFIRMQQATGQLVLASPLSIALHPRFDRFATGARYYVARNALGPLRALGLPWKVRMRRAMHEVIRAARMQLCGRDDMARLHLAGLADSIDSPRGAAPPSKLRHNPFAPLTGLAASLADSINERAPLRRIGVDAGLVSALSPQEVETLNTQIGTLVAQHAGAAVDIIDARGGALSKLRSLLQRILIAPPQDIAVVNAKGLAPNWFAGRTIVHVSPGAGFVVGHCPARERWACIARAILTSLRGTRLALRAANADLSAAVPMERADSERAASLTLSVVVLSYNRRQTLSSTLDRLRALPELAGAELIVVDNASSDGSVDMARAIDGVDVVALDANVGVDAINTGVDRATRDVVLILDDDAWPEERAVAGAMHILSRRPDVAAVTLHPHHPAKRRSEWPFAASLHGSPDDRWPVMGCANLVRREAWRRAGGYEKSYFLYRNDTDLALKLLALRRARAENATAPLAASGGGGRVYFDPTWIVWHDSPAAARKSERWHFLATRNWIWTARRHGRGASGLLGLTLGWMWAHRLAGASAKRHWQTLRGAIRGIVETPPPLTQGVEPTGVDFAKLLRLHLGRFGRR